VQLQERREPQELFQEAAVEGSAEQPEALVGRVLNSQLPQVALLALAVVAALVAERKLRQHQALALLVGFTEAAVVAVVDQAPQATAAQALLVQSSSNMSLPLSGGTHCFTCTSVLELRAIRNERDMPCLRTRPSRCLLLRGRS
jgi:hypothetical protein